MSHDINHPNQDLFPDRVRTEILMFAKNDYTVRAWSPVSDDQHPERYLTIRQSNSVQDKSFTFMAPNLAELERFAAAVLAEIAALSAFEPHLAPDAHLDDIGD